LAGIYIHIPFCSQACHYCDFHFSTSLKLKSDLIASICHEITLQKGYLNNEAIETVYLGGGTPSLLDEGDLQQVFSALKDSFEWAHAAEVTLEANPEDLTTAKLDTFKKLGVNRLSIGIQSFWDEHLRFMNRSHSSSQALKCVELAQKAGFENISIDLIYGVPFRDHSVWQNDLEKAIELNIPHISAYCLTIEEKTAFGQWQKTGKLAPIDDHFAAEQFEMLVSVLESAGYEQYEISNFAKPGRYSKHNTAYWQQKPYLGIGPSAHSYNSLSRQYNIANNAAYIKALGESKIPTTVEVLEANQAFNEYLLTTLRTMWGTSLELAGTKFGVDLLKEKEKELSLLHKEELLFTTDSTLYLTKKGKLFADEITSQLML
jgi:oxygen-independent coproporphyrinogen III oxidase